MIGAGSGVAIPEPSPNSAGNTTHGGLCPRWLARNDDRCGDFLDTPCTL